MTSPTINGVPGARNMSLNSLALMGAERQLRYYYTGSALVHFLVHFRHFNTICLLVPLPNHVWAP